MPGIVVFKRRWSLGSDDFVVPAFLLLLFHGVWLLVLCIIMGVTNLESAVMCRVGSVTLKSYVLVYIVTLAAAVIIEGIVFFVSLRGTILEPNPRASMQYLLYVRLVMLVFELSWQILGVVWLAQHYVACPAEVPKKVTLAMIICNWCLMVIIVIGLWCSYDYAGGKWVKMKRFQESLKEKQRSKRHSGRRNWRQRSSFVRLISVYSNLRRKAMRAYEESWDRRFNLLCCCVDTKNNNRNSIAEIAKLFTEFFRDLDVVPSDVIAGFVLLRRYQSLRMRHVVSQGSNDVYKYLSGTPVTPATEFLQLGQTSVLEEFHKVVHYMRFALAAYGWPAIMMMNTGSGICRILPTLRCCCCVNKSVEDQVHDNCCQCNFMALLKLSHLKVSDIVYATYHVDIGETPFYVAIDHKYKKVVICVRGTLSLQDVLTDLKADAEILPLDPMIEEWVGHKGMVQAAVYIRDRLKEEELLTQAFSKDDVDDTYQLVLVGHSLGAGTAAILAILLKQEFPNLHCYSFSPPGGLLSEACVRDTKSFITSVVVGKDIVPRIGLSQLELLRADLINVIKNSTESKWKIISRGLCCGNSDARKMKMDEVRLEMERDIRAHPSDSGIALSAHTPLFPPGKIIHIVRSHPTGKKKSICCCNDYQPVYQAIWANMDDFDEVLVSPTMINDHMPDKVLDALEKVLINIAPPKPVRTLTEAERQAFLDERTPSGESLNLLQTTVEPNVNTEIETLPRFLYEEPPEDPVMTLDPEGNLVITGSKTKPKLVLDLNSKDPVEAPLASPDTVSDRSSVPNSASQNSDLLDTYRKTLQNPPVMETIQQSPEVKRSVEKSNQSDYTNDDKVRVGNESSGNSILTEAVVEREQTEEKKSVVNSNIQENSVTVIDGPNLKTEETEKNNTEEHILEKSHKLDFCDVDKYSRNKVNQTNHIDQILPDLSWLCDEGRVSPDESNQTEYGNPNYCYSASGIGYPHGSGAYHPPIDHCSEEVKCEPLIQRHKTCSPATRIKSTCQYKEEKKDDLLKTSQSESFLQNLSDKYLMRRSQEQGDIAHLQDSVSVYQHRLQGNDNALQSGDLMAIHEDCCNFPSLPSEIYSSVDGIVVLTSPSSDSEHPLSSVHSDDVFDLPLEETDV